MAGQLWYSDRDGAPHHDLPCALEKGAPTPEHALLVADEQREDLTLPHVSQRINPGTPPPGRLGFRRQRSLLPLPCRPLAHPGGCSCYLLLLSFHELCLSNLTCSSVTIGPEWNPGGLTSLQDGLGDRQE